MEQCMQVIRRGMVQNVHTRERERSKTNRKSVYVCVWRERVCVREKEREE